MTVTIRNSLPRQLKQVSASSISPHISSTTKDVTMSSGSKAIGSKSSSGRCPLQSRNPNTIGSHGSLNSSSTEEYNSKEMLSLNRISNLEASQNENNKRLTNSESYGAGGSNNQNSNSNCNVIISGNAHQVRRNGSSNDLREASEPGVPTVPRPVVAQRSNSLPTSAASEGENVIIEEKRRKVVGDGFTMHRYLRGRLLGKGGFAKVYLCTALDTNKAYAIKIVPKANLVKARARQKLQAEIKIHRTLKHKNVCEYKHFFEDRQNCYILLELCHNQSMNEMLKRRKRLTEPETAYFMKQLLEATKYLHEQLVIHRDLKLGNLFLDKNLNIKVGDLGLATKLESPDEKRKTICGTPNYIAPEVIQGDRATRGHSFEVDVWSMGVIMFTCLVGKPPYEAKDVKATYQRILANEYSFPNDIPISDDGKDLICRMLQSNPIDRPSIKDISAHPFFTAHVVPDSLPANATHVAPKWENSDYIGGTKTAGASVKPAVSNSSFQRRPFGTRDINVDRAGPETAEKKVVKPSKGSTPTTSVSPMLDVQGAVKNAWSAVVNAATASTPQAGFHVFDENQDRPNKHKDIATLTANMGIRTQETSSAHSSPQRGIATPSGLGSTESDALILNRMVDRLTTVLDVVSRRSYSTSASEFPSISPSSRAGPSKWVARYVDYTSKYGLGYLLNEGSSGVYFNDSTKSVLEAKGDVFQYIDRKKASVDSPRRSEPIVTTHSLEQFPEDLQKKVTLLKHFRSYLIEQQSKAEESDWFPPSSKANPNVEQMVYLKKWVRTKHAIFFRLSDQTVQIVFYDHTEVLLTPDERHITYVDKNKNRNTYFLTDELVGSNAEIAKRLKYTKDILVQLVTGVKR